MSKLTYNSHQIDVSVGLLGIRRQWTKQGLLHPKITNIITLQTILINLLAWPLLKIIYFFIEFCLTIFLKTDIFF